MLPARGQDEGRAEGAISADGQILGTYIHGVFDTPAACNALLNWAELQTAAAPDLAALREHSLERLADAAIPLLAALTDPATANRARHARSSLPAPDFGFLRSAA